MDGTIENIDITDGILLTTSEFVSQEDIEMTTTHDDLSLFQISFCIDGNMEWSYINNEVTVSGTFELYEEGDIPYCRLVDAEMIGQ